MVVFVVVLENVLNPVRVADLIQVGEAKADVGDITHFGDVGEEFQRILLKFGQCAPNRVAFAEGGGLRAWGRLGETVAVAIAYSL